MKQFCVMFIALLFAGSNVLAQDVPAATQDGPVILTISGALNSNKAATFTLKQLQSLTSHSFTLTHDWTDTPRTYTGPLLSEVLKKAGASGQSLKLVALNDYFVDVDMAFVDKYQPILAWQEDGKRMRVRNKGPLWLMTPLHRYPELSDPAHVSKLIWQLNSIEVR